MGDNAECSRHRQSGRPPAPKPIRENPSSALGGDHFLVQIDPQRVADGGVEVGHLDRAPHDSWLSVLQASHLIFLVRPWFTNTSKRFIKTPKLYFCDPGLAAWFLGVRKASHVTGHPQRGALFENWVMTELLKAQANAGQRPALYFLRDHEGHEIDALIESAPNVFQPVEIKSGETIASDSFDGLSFWRNKPPDRTLVLWLVHGGIAHQQREKATILPWNDLGPLRDSLAAS